MLKSICTLFLFFLGQIVALAFHQYLSFSLGLSMFIGFALTLLILHVYPYVDRWKPSALARQDYWLVALFLLFSFGLTCVLTPFQLSDEQTLLLFRQMTDNPWGALTVVVLGPIVEELAFRGGIQQHLKQTSLPRWGAVLITSVLFGLIHGNFMQALPAIPLGFALGWLYEKRAYRVVIPVHVANNFVAFIMLRYAESTDFIESLPPLLLLSAGIVFVAIGAWGLYQLLQNT